MAFAIKATPSSSSFPAAVQSSSPLPRRAARLAMVPARRGVTAMKIRAVAAAPAAPAPAMKGRRLPVSQTMSRLKAKGKTAFIPYVTAGDPDLATTAEALRLLDACGADVIELGLPFSDPYADGPVIQASSARALAGGATMDGVLEMLKEVTPELSCPVVLFSYFNPIVRRGLANFTAAAKEAGVHGLIVPDLPYVAACTLRSEAMKNNLELVIYRSIFYNQQLFCAAHNTGYTRERMKEITKASAGFIYLVSVNGVTGPRATVNSRVQSLIQEIKQVTDKPVAVGFGLSKPEHVTQIAE
ncbi:hypothetical protein PR202_ga13794 [Eleusine coracana subsp. coracana]|uniref:tryptophan synthase n=1 Tax=Eleusine coracana subsp. coracana TaxID=191504 RepID=A0AAV5CFM8_ELECO|nr:hypothetical protein PR202_ga13794 [Eleusine coracana subsp. coracana]